MSKGLHNYFTTGEFAGLCKVKKQTLFHYDDIGVLPPEKVGTNGYRYYSYTQLDTFHCISVLRELGMPLSEIKKYLDHRSPERLLQLLSEQQKQVEQKINELMEIKQFIRIKKELTDEGINTPFRELIIEQRPREYFLITEYSGKNEEKALAEAFTEHLNYCHSMNIYSPYGIGGMIPVDTLISTGEQIYTHFYTKLDKGESPRAKERAAGLFAVYCDRGYEKVEENCLKLIAFARESGFEPGTHVFDDIILDEMSRSGEENYMVKLSLALLPRKAAADVYEKGRWPNAR